MKTINKTIKSTEVVYNVLELQNGKLEAIDSKSRLFLESPSIDKIQKILQKEEGPGKVIVMLNVYSETAVYSISVEDFMRNATKITTE